MIKSNTVTLLFTAAADPQRLTLRCWKKQPHVGKDDATHSPVWLKCYLETGALGASSCLNPTNLHLNHWSKSQRRRRRRRNTHTHTHKWPNRLISSHQLSFSPLRLLQWPLAPLMPAHIPPDSVFAGNKCPSFTVCWLIYTNYRSLCSREDHQIVPDESIKSLLSQGISLLWSDQVLGEHGERQKHEYCTLHSLTPAASWHHTTRISDTHTHTLRSR